MTTLAIRPLLIFAILAGCSAPTTAFLGIDPVRVEVSSRTFDVYAKDNAAQAVRINREWGARSEDVFDDAKVAIESATSCSVVSDSINGDVAVVNAKLAC